MNKLRRYLTVFCMLAMIATPLSVFANFIVVTPDQVVVNEEGLYVEVDGTLQIVESITMANDGYIVAIPNPDLWYCKVCKNHVPYPLENCPRCGNQNPRDQG